MAHRYELEKYREHGAVTNVLPVTVNSCQVYQYHNRRVSIP